MKRAIVFHAPDGVHFPYDAAEIQKVATELWRAEKYRIAAFIGGSAGDDETLLDNAFQQTNHINSDWTDNPGVIAGTGGQRSTSVGDIVMLFDAHRAHAFVCDRIGWAAVPETEEQK